MGRHSAPRNDNGGWSRSRWFAVVGSGVLVVGATGGAIAYAATRGPTAAQKQARAEQAAHARQVALETAMHNSQAQLLSSLQITPSSGAADVPLDATVTVATTTGTISEVKVVSASGAPLAGALSPDGKWVATGGLLPSTTYTITVSAAGNGVTVDHTSTFSTLTPTETVTASVYPTNGMVVGVGQPIVVELNHDVTDPAVQKAIDARFTVAMSQPVPGSWYWFNSHELHFRPQNFWPAHETIQVTGDLNGIDVGSGKWTAGSVLDSFATGDARISYANLQTEKMTVTLNGVVLYTFPISGGRPQYPTMNGIHLVLDRESVVHMVSSTVGIPVNSPNGYDELVYDDVHISDSGEYVHAAPWSVGDQGVTNVSHGCINLSTANAQTFFDFSRVGDLVEVTGSPRPAASGDHGVMDWTGPTWAAWTPGNVVALTPAGAAPTTTVAPAPPSTTATTVAPAVAGRPVDTVAPANAAASTTTVPATTTPSTTAPTVAG